MTQKRLPWRNLRAWPDTPCATLAPRVLGKGDPNRQAENENQGRAMIAASAAGASGNRRLVARWWHSSTAARSTPSARVMMSNPRQAPLTSSRPV